MEEIDRRIGARSAARLLGDWRPPDGRGLTDALADRVRLLVLDGRLPLQTRMPAERELAAALGVSRTTVAAAYEALRGAGMLHSRRGAGSWTQLDPRTPVAPGTPFSPSGTTPGIDLAHAALAAPIPAVRAATAAAALDLDALLCGHGYDLLGRPELRAAIADRFTARGLPTRPDQVLVTSGAQHAFALILARWRGRATACSSSTRPTPTRSTRCAPAAPARCRCRWARAATAPGRGTSTCSPRRCATPRRGSCTSSPISTTRPAACSTPRARERLVALARRTGTPVVLDETMTELALDGPPPPPAASFGGADSTHVSDGRLGQQGVLGRAAGGVDPGVAAARATARRGPGRAGPRRARPSNSSS